MSSSNPDSSSNPASLGPEAGEPERSAGSMRDSNPQEAFRQKVADNQKDVDDDVEQHLWSGGYSPKAMVGTWIMLVLASIGLIVLGLVTLAWLVAAGIILVIWLIGGLVYAWRRLGFHYELTNQRFIHQTGILTRKTDRIEVIDIDDVTYTQGPIERIFGVGTIILTSSDRTHPTLTMIGIDNVKEIAGLIDDVRRKERRRRSLHIEAI